MSTSSFRRQGDPLPVGWSIGHAPLWMRGIRLANGEGGSAPAGTGGDGDNQGGQTHQQGEPQSTPNTPTPAQVAQFYASQNSGQAPTAAPTQPAAPQQIQGFTPEQVQKLMSDNAAAQKAIEDAQAAAQQAQKERDEYQAQVTEFQRSTAVTAAATDKANAALLLDSTSFQTAIKDVDLNDVEALKTAVAEFVDKNPNYAAAPQLPGSSGAPPAGGTTDKPTTLEGAIAARLGG